MREQVIINPDKELAVINPENVSEEEIKTYPQRMAARAVVVDDENNVALLYVANEDYYKLPGGGVEEKESIPDALARECKEEIGVAIEIVGGIGSIIEHRKIFCLTQISECYLAKTKGPKGNPNFTEEELKNGFRQVWVPYDHALSLLSQSQATSIEGKSYIVPRDTIFLKAARDLFAR